MDQTPTAGKREAVNFSTTLSPFFSTDEHANIILIILITIVYTSLISLADFKRKRVVLSLSLSQLLLYYCSIVYEITAADTLYIKVVLHKWRPFCTTCDFAQKRL